MIVSFRRAGTAIGIAHRKLTVLGEECPIEAAAQVRRCIRFMHVQASGLEWANSLARRERHFGASAIQFSTTVNGVTLVSSTLVTSKNRCPSRVTA